MSLARPRVLEPRQRPREGPTMIETSIMLAPALRKLSAAGDDPDKVTEAIDDLPAFLLVPLIECGLSRHVISFGVMGVLVVAAGTERLEARFGKRGAAALVNRFLS